jgi:hypothetical protein
MLMAKPTWLSERTGYSTNIGRAYLFYNDGSIPTTAATADVIITANELVTIVSAAFSLQAI